MPILAIAGGSSPTLGRAIVSAVISTLPHWSVVILSRNNTRPLWLRALDPESIYSKISAVDYMSIDSLVPALQGVDTLVSVTSAIDGSQAQIQINLLNAGIQAGCK